MKRPHLYDPGFKYTPAASTDIARTFARIRREMKQTEATKPPATNVKALPKKAKETRRA